jgi:hypothetical protein
LSQQAVALYVQVKLAGNEHAAPSVGSATGHAVDEVEAFPPVPPLPPVRAVP